MKLLCENGSVTEQRVAEAIPAAPVASGQPPAAQTGGEAERRAEQADQHVTAADVDEEQVGWSSQGGEARKHQERQEVPEEAQDQDEAQNDGRRGVTCPAQTSRVRPIRTLLCAEVVAMLQKDHHGSLRVGKLKPKDDILLKIKRWHTKIMNHLKGKRQTRSKN